MHFNVIAFRVTGKYFIVCQHKLKVQSYRNGVIPHSAEDVFLPVIWLEVFGYLGDGSNLVLYLQDVQDAHLGNNRKQKQARASESCAQ